MKRIAIVALVLVASLGLVGAPPPADAHHSNPCSISNPEINPIWGCGKHNRYASNRGSVAVDDTHTNGRGVYVYVQYYGRPYVSQWDWLFAHGGGWVRSEYFNSGSRSVQFVWYCDGAKWSNGANCIGKWW